MLYRMFVILLLVGVFNLASAESEKGKASGGTSVSNVPVRESGSVGSSSNAAYTFLYQGIISYSDGSSVSEGLHSLTFRIYDSPDGGADLWTEVIQVSTQNGYFSAVLGLTNPLNLPKDKNLYIGIQVEGDVSEMTPRQQIAALNSTDSNSPGNPPTILNVSDVDWSEEDLGSAPYVLYTMGEWGLSRGSIHSTQPNLFFGDTRNHVDLGRNGTTGTNGQNYTNCTIGGGQYNQATSDATTVAGGTYNYATEKGAIIGGGTENRASGKYSAIIGGNDNTASGGNSAVGGGAANTASGGSAAIFGGEMNRASGTDASIIGGLLNLASGNYSTAAGGRADTVKAVYGGAAAGYANKVGDATTDTGAFVGGGVINAAFNKYATISGGKSNGVESAYGVIGGGNFNSVRDDYGTIGGGYYNKVEVGADYGAVGGGYSHTVSGAYSTIGGGNNNEASGSNSTVGGGTMNVASGSGATVSGGNSNFAAGINSFVGGGTNNTAGGANSFAGGNSAEAPFYGDFVWADNTGTPFAATLENQFLVRASGGVGFNTDSPNSDFSVVGNADISGNVGIGTATPATKLDVIGDLRVSDGVIKSASGFMLVDDTYTRTTVNAGQLSLCSSHSVIPPVGGLYTEGNVGIGAASPQTQLEVAGTIRSTYPDNPSLYTDVYYHQTQGPTIEGHGFSKLSLAPNGAIAMTLQDDGKVGIGTASPTEELDINGTSKTLGFQMPTGAGTAKILTSDANGIGTWQTAPLGSQWLDGSGGAIYYNGGNVGIGTSTPNDALDVKGYIQAGQISYYDGQTLIMNSGKLAIKSGLPGPVNEVVVANSDSKGDGQLVLKNTAGHEIALLMSDESSNGLFRLNDYQGYPVVEIGKGLDFAEGFPTKYHDLEPGTVMAIDEGNPGSLTISRCAYDRKVAGVIAGADGLNSGVRLGVSEEPGSHPVALAGRVFCKVDGSFGAVKLGDLLTTSPNPGYAMVVSDPSKAQGAIIGKAMGNMPKGSKGNILVLVTLQ
jgi:hypothetical protein